MRDAKAILLMMGLGLSLSGCVTNLPFTHAADDPRFDTLKSETLTPFKSEADYKKWVRNSERLEAKREKAWDKTFPEDQDIIIATGSRVVSAPNITNVQNRGVDEGDIVKQIGDHLVLMQDGRLFSLDIGKSAPELKARIDIYDQADEDIWYDELLVSGRQLVVTGYHYGKNATEITVFDLDTQGQFFRRGRWYLESEDYYSGDNSATRMIGDTLIFHTQREVDEPENWPVLRAENESQTQSILKPENIHPPLLRISNPDLHIVTACKLSQDFQCSSRAIMASWRSEWIVTEKAGYLWIAAPRYDLGLSSALVKAPDRYQPNTLYRFPVHADNVEAVMLDATLPSRFAFEVRDERVLALVRTQERDLALLDMQMSTLSERPVKVSSTNFTPLPGEYMRQMRFTRDNLIYNSYIDDDDVVYVVNLESHLPSGPLPVPHQVGRLDRVGQNAVLIGPEEDSDDLYLSWLDLVAAPVVTDTLKFANRVEAEGRAQALNMRVEENGEALLGLPTLAVDDTGDWDEEDGTDISFTRVSNFGQLTDLGPAKGDPSRVNPDYTCETSCVDWYGNARPFFIGERIFALIASELIELQETSTGLIERSRVNLSAAP